VLAIIKNPGAGSAQKLNDAEFRQAIEKAGAEAEVF
jgi:hypothetical protein